MAAVLQLVVAVAVAVDMHYGILGEEVVAEVLGLVVDPACRRGVEQLKGTLSV